MTYPRGQLVSNDTAGHYHCVSRCVRRAFLCGVDAHSGKSFEHRRQWIEDRLLALAEIFAIGLCSYAVMSNHVHVVLLLDPERVLHWSEREVAARWVALFPPRNGDPSAHEQRMEAVLGDPERLARYRRRLSDLSWFMRCLNEPIARRANREDQCTGHFWEGRFKCQALLDDAAVLAAMVYVDLNPIRAGMTTRLDRSAHTSVRRRLEELRRDPAAISAPLAPIRGASTKRQFGLSSAQYIELVDWTGRQHQPGKRGAIPPDAARALARLGLADERWVLEVRAVGSGYWRAVGAVQLLLEKATAMGQQWLKGLGTARALARI